MCKWVLYGIKSLPEDVAGMGSWLVFPLISQLLFDCTTVLAAGMTHTVTSDEPSRRRLGSYF
jgi:hypothetical protein